MIKPTLHAIGERIAGPDQALAEMFDVRFVARLLGCSARHVYRLSDAGRMPQPYKLGALVRWSRSELTAWINAGCPPVHQEGKGAR